MESEHYYALSLANIHKRMIETQFKTRKLKYIAGFSLHIMYLHSNSCYACLSDSIVKSVTVGYNPLVTSGKIL